MFNINNIYFMNINIYDICIFGFFAKTTNHDDLSA